MTNPTQDFLPCPFCGKVPDEIAHSDFESWKIRHHCPVLGIVVMSRSSLESLRTHWNTRTAGPKPPDVKPAKYRPWNLEEVPVGAVVVAKQSALECGYSIHKALILATGSCVEEVLIGKNWWTLLFLFHNYTLANGSPCGVKEEA